MIEVVDEIISKEMNYLPEDEEDEMSCSSH
jgi:hypothetical protein